MDTEQYAREMQKKYFDQNNRVIALQSASSGREGWAGESIVNLAKQFEAFLKGE